MKNKQNEMLTTFVRDDNTVSERPNDFAPMANTVAVLTVFVLMAVYYYGLRAAVVSLVCVAVCTAADWICLILRGKKLHIHDISPVAAGLTIAVMMPASVPYTVAAAACVFAVCCAKHPFGGHGCELFSCAAAGYIFAELSFPSAVLSYPKPFTELALSNTVTQPLYSAVSSAAAIKNYSAIEVLIGNYSGPMGCTFIILTAVCAVYLMSRKAVSFAAFAAQTGVFMLWSFFMGGTASVGAALSGGMFIFASAFLTCDSSLVPSGTAGRLFYGTAAGILLICVSGISSLSYPAVYVSVLAAPLSRLIDSIDSLKVRRKRVKSIASLAINETITMIEEERNG